MNKNLGILHGSAVETLPLLVLGKEYIWNSKKEEIQNIYKKYNDVMVESSFISYSLFFIIVLVKKISIKLK